MKDARVLTRVPRLLLVLCLVGLFASITPVAAVTPTTGSLVAVGRLTASGLTALPPGTTPDPTTWWEWPSREWQLEAIASGGDLCTTFRPPSSKDSLDGPAMCGLAASGSMWGWCDLSKGQGSGLFWPPSWSMTTIHWSGGGSTLLVTGELWSWTGNAIYAYGTFTATITFLTSSGCSTHGGLTTPLPVLIELRYAVTR